MSRTFAGPTRLAIVALALVGAATSTASAADDRPISFLRDVRPILARNCFACHGPDEASREADLRLDTREGALGARPDGAAFVAGRPDASQALRRIVSADPAVRMPPPKHGPALAADDIERLRRWVSQGAGWQSHWSFQPPRRPPLPATRAVGWSRNPLDTLVLARLEHETLQPAAAADRPTLARRVALDLTGLPPSPEALAEYLADEGPDAYERMVDRLLAAPTYGERWARVWLDLARYADTKGYEKDRTRSLWRYRDWVIDAFDRDLPYDQFTREQLAGDLLPAPTLDQLLATAMHRNTMVNEEGGTDDEEFRVAAVKDRVDTTIQVWMGLTMGCGKCHSHKYDPISQREYYQFYAFFNQTEDSDKGDDRPTFATPTAEQQRALEVLRGQLDQQRAELTRQTQLLGAAARKWADERAELRGWTTLTPIEMTAESGAGLKRLDDDSLLASGATPEAEQYVVTAAAPVTAFTGLRLEAIPDPAQPKGGVGRARDDGNFVLTGLRIEAHLPDGSKQNMPLTKAEADFAQQDYPVEHVLKNPDPSRHGWAVSPQQSRPHAAVFSSDAAIALPSGTRLVVTVEHRFRFAYPGFALGRFRLAVTGDPAPSLKGMLPDQVLAIVRKPAGQRSENERQTLLTHYASLAPETAAIRQAIRLTEEQTKTIQPVQTPVLRELPPDKQRVTKIHVRGNFLEPSEEVAPAVPASFHPWPAEAPRNRLGVATWLTAPDNPLTARVAANRIWSQLFGQGLVETQEDFGSQGQPPSHPELLDWLAVELMSLEGSGREWSWKSLCRTIVLSATYRQSSRVSADLALRDRDNRLLARGARFRLDAETLRDNALAVAGLLSTKRFGPSVMPPQPDGIWRSTYNSDKWQTSRGEDRYRRGLYTFIKRTSPYPAMTTFDAPSREICTIRRVRTNTPLQALITLNDPAFVECAQALARRAWENVDGPPARRVEQAVRWALARQPRADEIATLEALYQRRLEEFRRDREAARRFATEPLGPLPDSLEPAELAAMTAVCHVILNLDEFLTRG